MKKTDAITLMIQHRQKILDTYTETGRNAVKTHELLKQSLPELQISISQFKPYIKAMALTAESMPEESSDPLKHENECLKEQVGELNQKITELRQEKEQAEAEIEKLKSELSKRLKPDRICDPDKRINGWNLVFSGGYFRLFRKVNGRMEAIYLGKKFDREVAETKIREKEKAIGIDG